MIQASRIAILITLSVALSIVARPATAQRLEESIIGTWEVDVEATKKLGGNGAQVAEDFSDQLVLELEGDFSFEVFEVRVFGFDEAGFFDVGFCFVGGVFLEVGVCEVVQGGEVVLLEF